MRSKAQGLAIGSAILILSLESGNISGQEAQGKPIRIATMIKLTSPERPEFLSAHCQTNSSETRLSCHFDGAIILLPEDGDTCGVLATGFERTFVKEKDVWFSKGRADFCDEDLTLQYANSGFSWNLRRHKTAARPGEPRCSGPSSDENFSWIGSIDLPRCKHLRPATE
jgi:hypothetical protein